MSVDPKDPLTDFGYPRFKICQVYLQISLTSPLIAWYLPPRSYYLTFKKSVFPEKTDFFLYNFKYGACSYESQACLWKDRVRSKFAG